MKRTRACPGFFLPATLDARPPAAGTMAATSPGTAAVTPFRCLTAAFAVLLALAMPAAAKDNTKGGSRTGKTLSR